MHSDRVLLILFALLVVVAAPAPVHAATPDAIMGAKHERAAGRSLARPRLDPHAPYKPIGGRLAPKTPACTNTCLRRQLRVCTLIVRGPGYSYCSCRLTYQRC